MVTATSLASERESPLLDFTTGPLYRIPGFRETITKESFNRVIPKGGGSFVLSWEDSGIKSDPIPPDTQSWSPECNGRSYILIEDRLFFTEVVDAVSNLENNAMDISLSLKQVEHIVLQTIQGPKKKVGVILDTRHIFFILENKANKDEPPIIGRINFIPKGFGGLLKMKLFAMNSLIPMIRHDLFLVRL